MRSLPFLSRAARQKAPRAVERVEKVIDAVETGRNIPMEVQRADGTVEFDVATDGYSILCERVRSSIRSLAKLDKGVVHTRPVFAAYVTGKPGKTGALETDSTYLGPVDPELAGGMAFAGLMAFRKHDAAGFAVLLRRLRDAGLTT